MQELEDHEDAPRFLIPPASVEHEHLMGDILDGLRRKDFNKCVLIYVKDHEDMSYSTKYTQMGMTRLELLGLLHQTAHDIQVGEI